MGNTVRHDHIPHADELPDPIPDAHATSDGYTDVVAADDVLAPVATADDIRADNLQPDTGPDGLVYAERVKGDHLVFGIKKTTQRFLASLTANRGARPGSPARRRKGGSPERGTMRPESIS